MHPTEAASAGAGWKIDGPGEWRHSGDTVDLLIDTDLYVIFKDIDGWMKPKRMHLDANRDQSISLDGTYVKPSSGSEPLTTPVSPDPRTHQADLGYLSVTIEPREAVQAGARWRIPGGEWQGSGAEIGPLVLIPVAVSFSSVPGWTKPESLEAGIKAGSNQVTGNYRPVNR